MIGQSVPMRQLMSLIERVASSDVPVLITGESGTGKEDTAQLIHKLSSRSDGPYVPVNCAAIPEPLVESHVTADFEQSLESFRIGVGHPAVAARHFQAIV